MCRTLFIFLSFSCLMEYKISTYSLTGLLTSVTPVVISFQHPLLLKIYFCLLFMLFKFS